MRGGVPVEPRSARQTSGKSPPTKKRGREPKLSLERLSLIERRRFEEKRRVGILGGDVVRLRCRASFFSCGGTCETCPILRNSLKFATAFVAVMLMAVRGGAAAASAQGRMSDEDT